MSLVALDRRFVEWNDQESPNSEVWRGLGLGSVSVGWDELLIKRRVVILAEAGSGKTTEMKIREQMVCASKRYAFYSTVEEVGEKGLEGSLTVLKRTKLASWRTSGEDARFFIDSVDEGKSSGIRLEKVLRRVAEGIDGAEERAYIVLSGRITDWEFRKDLNLFEQSLPTLLRIPVPFGTPEEELLKALRPTEEEPSQSERPFVALMTPLDRDRVRRFAEAEAATNVPLFLEAVERENLWNFANRPLDLQWLVEFWKTKGRLGSLAEMVELSITERLKEPDLHRARADSLEAVRSRCAVERFAAAMVFGRQRTIAIPDSELVFSSDSAFDPADVLPDWSARDRALLLSRAIFDPATLGRLRFHNDNEGVIRGFLTAKWLLNLRKENLSSTALFDLLFADSYGLKVIKPSLNETVAWLSLWDEDVANEVISRDPALLLGGGDPASLSSEVRKKVLLAVLEKLTTADSDLPILDNHTLRRFAQPELGKVVCSIWPQFTTNGEAKLLLLRIVSVGQFKECGLIVAEAAFDSRLPPRARVLAGRALLVVSDQVTRKRYSELIITEASRLPQQMVHEGLVALFPALIGVRELLKIVEESDLSKDQEGINFRLLGPVLIEKLNTPSELEEVLSGLLAQVGGDLREHTGYLPSDQEDACFPAMAAAASRLLQATDAHSVPELAVDAILRLCNRSIYTPEVRARVAPALSELHRTSSRRRLAFWRVAHSLRRPALGWHPINQLWQMTSLGYPPGLIVEDVDWLLSDGLTQGVQDRQLAVNASLQIYHSAGKPTGLLETIASAVAPDAVASEVYRELTEPKAVVVEQDKTELNYKQVERRSTSERVKHDRSWLKFIRDLRADCDRVKRLKVPPFTGVNPDLQNLWLLLSGGSTRPRYSIGSVLPLQKIVGAEVAQAVQSGLIAHWRAHSPTLRSQRSPEDRNVVLEADLMGVAGVSLEAATIEGWSEKLSSFEAARAANYATMELNGFPSWVSALAASNSAEVRDVLIAEVRDELTQTGLTHFDTLHNVANGEEEIAVLLAPTLLEDIETGAMVPSVVLADLLRLLVKGVRDEHIARLKDLLIERFEKESDVDLAAKYVAAVFGIDPRNATEALETKVTLLDIKDRVALVEGFLRATFGDSNSVSGLSQEGIRPDTLEQLVRLSFITYDQGPVAKHPRGVAYGILDSDYANRARSNVLNLLAQTPGVATYRFLVNLQKDPSCPIPTAELRMRAEHRALEDSESAPWPPAEARLFEEHHEIAPRTPKDLQTVVLGRIRDIKHDLVHGDFSQGKTLKALEHEVDVQNWIADRLRSKQGRSFSVEREPHVAEEKEPDLRVRAKDTDSSVAIEIKVAESWTVQELDGALEVQLCGQYLRAKDQRYGILLLVHKEARPNGWKDRVNNKFLSFAQVRGRLSERATFISESGYDAAQPQIAFLDVSSCGQVVAQKVHQLRSRRAVSKLGEGKE